MIIIQFIIARELGCGIQKTTNCDDAYNLFLSCYNKTFSVEGSATFCKNLIELIPIIDTCDSCSVTAVADIDFKRMQPQTELEWQSYFTTSTYCQMYICAASLSESTMPTLSSVYTSVHLKEAGLITTPKNQGSYGSCWAFSTVAVLENSILLDKDRIVNAFWRSQTATLDLSEAFVAVNARGFNHYNNGGSFTTAVHYISQEPSWLTVETESNYPYSGMAGYVSGYSATNDATLLPAIVSAGNYFKPFVDQTYNGRTTPAVAVVTYNSGTKFTTANIMKVKSYLTRGFAISLAMLSSVPVFNSYDGTSYMTSPCGTFSTDHAVTLVGYGTYKGKEVWVIKNSWGTSWGASGYFYTPIGDDNFCIEHQAYTVIPKYYVASDGAYASIGSQTRGGTKDLDKDYGQTESNLGAISPMQVVKYSLTNNSVAYTGSVTSVVIKDVNLVTIYSGVATTYTTNARASKFPLSITVTVAGTVITKTGITDASNYVISVGSGAAGTPKWVQFTIVAGGSSYNGGMTVALTDINSNSVYSGTANTWSGFVDSLIFPLSITVTPVTGYDVYQRSGVTAVEASIWTITLVAVVVTQKPVSYTVTAAGTPYSGQIRVIITDKSNVVVNNLTQASYSTTINSDRFPISVTATPSSPYAAFTRSGIAAADAVNIQIQLQNATTPVDPTPTNTTNTSSSSTVAIAVGASIGGAAAVGVGIGIFFAIKSAAVKAAAKTAAAVVSAALPTFPPTYPPVTPAYQGQPAFQSPQMYQNGYQQPLMNQQPVYQNQGMFLAQSDIVPATGQIFQGQLM